MPPPPWDDDMNRAFETLTGVTIDEVEQQAAEHNRQWVGREEFQDWFTESFMTRKDSEYNTIAPNERHEQRLGFFAYWTYLGYTDPDIEDWDHWRAVASSAGVMA